MPQPMTSTMHKLRNRFLAAAIALVSLAPVTAMAHDHGHHGGPRIGINLQFGSSYPYYGYGHYYNPWRHGWYGPYYGRPWVYGPAYYLYDEIPVYTRETTRIIERPAPRQEFAGPPPAQNWYLCEDSGYYYPYVTECASDWIVVPATPPR